MIKTIIDFKWLIKNKLLYSLVLSGLVLNAVTWLLIFRYVPRQAEWIPLHYSAYFGIDWIGLWTGIFYFPVVGLLVIIINTLLANYLQLKMEKAARSLIIAMTIVQLFNLINLGTLFYYYFS